MKAFKNLAIAVAGFLTIISCSKDDETITNSNLGKGQLTVNVLKIPGEKGYESKTINTPYCLFTSYEFDKNDPNEDRENSLHITLATAPISGDYKGANGFMTGKKIEAAISFVFKGLEFERDFSDESISIYMHHSKKPGMQYYEGVDAGYVYDVKGSITKKGDIYEIKYSGIDSNGGEEVKGYYKGKIDIKEYK